MRENQETPAYEARHHSSRFLKTAARLASKRTTKGRKAKRGTSRRSGGR